MTPIDRSSSRPRGAGSRTAGSWHHVSVLPDIEIRAARPGDALGLADAWGAFGRDYAALDPGQFVVPDAEGLASWFEARLGRELGDDATWLVAERDDRVIGFVQAQIWRPAEDADRQLMREMTEPILKIDSLMVLEEARRSGLGERLMRTVERWGQERGATRAVVIASVASAPAIAFYEERMEYERRTIRFSKPLL